ncbi:MAG TPA: hypothetical protein EYF98_01345 [Planctomycetes bacterium]|nr:hypothetical protein [Planctomycetota bacterium]
MLSRRELLWLATLATSSGLLSKKGMRAKYPTSFWDHQKSPPTTPFVRPLPCPRPPNLVSGFPLTGCEPPFPFPPNVTRHHRIVEEEVSLELHPDLPLTSVWRYRDMSIAARAHGDQFGLFMAGPTIIAKWLTPTVVRMRNNLPKKHVGFGVNHTTTHYHGAHCEARSDGFPEQGMSPNPTFDPIVLPGEERDYCYAMQDVGFSTGEPSPEERPATQWYHDHLLDFTGANVQRGLAGFLLAFDDLDTGDEMTGLRLPSLLHPGTGDVPGFDIPLVFADRLIAPDGSLVYLPEDFDGFIGDKHLVNGRIDPFLEVEARKYRLRILIGTNAAMLGLRLINASGETFPFDAIANGGGLFASPIRDLDFTGVLAPAMRLDIIVDFSQFPVGTKLYLEDAIKQEDGRGPDGDFEDPDLFPAGEGSKRLEFRVVPATGPDNSQVPNVLRPITPIPQSELDAATRREFEFHRGNGAWKINGEFVDIDTPCATIPLNTPEIWTLKNGGGGWWHPIHVHLEFMRILTRNGKQPPLRERDGFSKTDTINLGPGDEVEAFFKFRDFPGPWVFHCHNIEHEDHFMMVRFDVS